MKKITLLLTYMVSMGFAFSSYAEEASTSLKEQVAIVTPTLTEEMKSHAKEMSSILSQYNYYSAASEYKAYKKGWSGSGFVIKGKDGKYYLITNKHVTRGVKEVTVEFQGESSAKYQNCPVVRESEDIDVALVELPNDFKTIQPLDFYAEKLNEGDDVWSAGYPGLGKNPVWQLGKGIISNMSVKDKDFGDEEKFHVIQHTAQVDAGNSGGPLLVKKDKKGGEAKYYVIGINTWKAGGRENTNFSIPTRFITEFLNEAIVVADTKASKENENIEEMGNKLYNALLSSYEDVLPLISDEYTYEVTGETFKEMYENASPDAQKEAKEKLKDAKGCDALKILIADNLIKSVQKKKQTLVLKETKLSQNGATATSTFSYKGKEKTFTWEKERGQWKVASSSLYSKESGIESETGVHIIKDNGNSGWAISCLKGTNDYSILNIELSYNRYFAKFGMRSITVYGGRDINPTLSYIYIDNVGTETIVGDTVVALGIKYNIGARLPIAFGKSFAITPYLLPGGGYGSSTLYWNVRGGVNFGWRYIKNGQLYLGAFYDYKRGKCMHENTNVTRNYVGMTIGIDY